MPRNEETSSWLRGLSRAEMPPRYVVVVASGLLFMATSDMAISVMFTVSPQPQAIVSVLATLLYMGGLLLLTLPVWHPRQIRQVLWRLRAVAFAGVATAGFVTIFMVVLLSVLVISITGSRAYPSDVMSLTRYNAGLIVKGHNPYTSDTLYSDALRRYSAALPTPMRRGIFGTGMVYPTDKHVIAVEYQYLTDPSSTDGAFDPRTLHSYPALSFLLYVPAVAAGLQNILMVNVLVWIGLLVWLAWLAPPGMRRWALLTLFSLPLVLSYGAILDTEVIVLAFLLPAWHFRSRPYLSATLLGLACAYKQYAWFFVPVFAIVYIQDFGWLDVFKRGAVALAAFLLPNLPFILISPGPWLTSLFLPMSDPMFPLGIGAIVLSMGHLVPYAPTWVYAALEGVSMLGAMYCQVRFRNVLGDAVLLLALVPFFFAFRSATDYFAVAPLLAFYAINQRTRSSVRDVSVGSEVVSTAAVVR